MKHSKILIGVAVVAIFLVLAGFVVAETLEGRQYTGCLSRQGFIYGITIGDQPKRACRGRDTEISWNETGPPGPQGLPGAGGEDGDDGDDGPPGANGIHCWDLDEDGDKDFDTEDLNGDGEVDVNDCLGPEGPKGEPGQSAGVAGYEIKEERAASGPGVKGFSILSCPAGKVPIGGGYSHEASPTGCMTVFHSAPDTSPGRGAGWQVGFDNQCSSDLTFHTVYVICAYPEE